MGDNQAEGALVPEADTFPRTPLSKSVAQINTFGSTTTFTPISRFTYAAPGVLLSTATFYRRYFGERFYALLLGMTLGTDEKLSQLPPTAFFEVAFPAS